MSTPPDAQARAAVTYDAAADFFDHEANSFWDLFGQRTVERLGLPRGARVLDACCGSGASAIPAARAVGPGGEVLGVDLSERLLERARAKAAAAGLEQAAFRRGDVFGLGLPDGRFDAVLCVFGIFFVPDMPGAVRELWRLVAPGGRLAITTWGPDVFEPLASLFWDAVQAERPDLCRAFNPWERLVQPEALHGLFAQAGLQGAVVEAQAGRHALATPEHAWALVLGTGFRGTLEQLAPDARERVRAAVQARVRSTGLRDVGASVLYAVVTRAGGGAAPAAVPPGAPAR